MNSKYWIYFILIFINLSVFISAYLYPPVRDQFYYIPKTSTSLIAEYWNAYHFGNPRIGQLVTNSISRNQWVSATFAVFLFNLFFVILFLLIFRRLPKLKDSKDLMKFGAIVSTFSFLIFVFGEMFYYTSFSGNYTFLMCFHLFYIYIFTEYYIYNRIVILNKNLVLPLFIFLGIITGMGNEHIPPVLIFLSFVGILYYFFKNKTLPNITILLYQLSVMIGYLLLYFAPANAIKYKVVGKSEGFSIDNYIHGLKNVFNLYRFYNPELVVVIIFNIIFGYLLIKQNKIEKKEIIRLSILFISGLLAIPIVAYAPLSGTRLLFFSNTLFIIVFLNIIINLEYFKKVKVIGATINVIYLFVFFTISVVITKYGRDNYDFIMNEIKTKSTSEKSVSLESGFDYFNPKFGLFNRRILLESGKDYLRNNTDENSSQELILRSYFKINDISVIKK